MEPAVCWALFRDVWDPLTALLPEAILSRVETREIDLATEGRFPPAVN